MINNNLKDKRFIEEACVHYNYFMGIARKLTQNQSDAEDLVQDTFARAYEFYSSYRPGSNCKAWLYTILKNLFYNYYKKKKNLNECYFDSIPEDVYVSKEEFEMRRYEILKLMECVKDEHRAIIIMFHLNEYSLKEISHALDLPVGTVKSRLYRARKEFRRTLDSSGVGRVSF